MNQMMHSEYGIYILAILFFLYTRFRLRNSYWQKYFINVLLTITLPLGGFVSYFFQDYTLGIAMHCLYILQWILFKDFRNPFRMSRNQ
ncbi:hypothetical protein SAMN05444392_10798 [Seinonella peptonophila]|uniref:Uncharacterized protein n=1 Tax=Seinonella peptonophila TaxID=112248 RepID=A0A1M4YRH5_9BACL|nr:hypothetical protein SAMN05444392_10798 [Seinonella peptonophila]